jgi:carbamoyl-phosphate synthase large subunit
MNVLITSAGRRTSLLNFFKDALSRRGGRLYAGDMDGLAPALYLADEAVRLPPIRSDEYLPFLASFVSDRSIALLVPTIDTELPALASAADRFAKAEARALVSSESFVRTTGDKWITATAFSQKGIRTPASWTPETLDPDRLPERLVVKPRDGSASKDVHLISRDALHETVARTPNPMIQEELRGSEITIDALIDFDGEPIHYVPRQRVRVVGGESIQGVTLPDEEIGKWIVDILRASAEMGATGPLTLQAFLTPDGPVLTEINPRFGGGYPLAHAAGGHYPEWILQMLEGRPIPPRLGEYRRGLCMTRHYTEIFTESPFWR